ncbi:MAG: Crp/Fnr family transcriptional regulator [Anaerolineae bacterium]|jgi:CRP-like cAMP-binding protein|nr:Crp/Fnr family transcriptional regulator [Anaerolineae bacterium]
MTNAQDITGFSPFRTLSEAATADLWARVRQTTAPRGEILFHTGDPASTLYLLISGAVKVTYGTANGDETTITVFQDGDLFGDLFLGKYRFRIGTATTLTTSRLGLLREDDFNALVAAHPSFALAMIQHYADRNREALARAHALMHVNAQNRLLGVLLNLSRHLCCPRSGWFTLPTGLTQSVIAQMACLNRSTVNQLLGALRDEGLVSGSGRGLSVDAHGIRDRLVREGAEILE